VVEITIMYAYLPNSVQKPHSGGMKLTAMGHIYTMGNWQIPQIRAVLLIFLEQVSIDILCKKTNSK
jgi:hypothetical protein